jgi:uncharacterized protein (DUF1499 family)
MLKNAIIGVGLIAAFGVAYIRYAPIYPQQWHVDPAQVERTGKPNDYLVAEGGNEPPVVLQADQATVAAALDAVVSAEPSTSILAGSAAEGFVTYVQRSRLMGFPDMVSVTLTPVETDAQPATEIRLYARARDGHSDLGVNAERVSRWLSALDAQLAQGG